MPPQHNISVPRNTIRIHRSWKKYMENNDYQQISTSKQHNQKMNAPTNFNNEVFSFNLPTDKG